MRGDLARSLACLAAALGALLTVAPAASAVATPRIINGSEASSGEYPAQGLLELITNQGTYVCGGSLVSNRYFLTAAHCATQPGTNTALAPDRFRIYLGKTDQNDFTTADRYFVSARQVNAGYNRFTLANDSALLTLATPARPALEPLRLVETGETALWSAGKPARIIGWGTTETGELSDRLLEANVPMVSDATCSAAWGSDFIVASMVCAGGGDTDTCGGDSGGPLMVGDGHFLVLAGLTSWGADPCAQPGEPGVYTRLGAPTLNSWVRSRVPMARASASDDTVEPSQAVTFSATASGPAPLTGFAWDFDSDGDTDATGASATHAYPAAGHYVARVTASGAGDDTATDKVAVTVGDPPPSPTPTPTPAVSPQPTSTPAPAAPPAGPPPGATAPPISLPPAVTATTGPLATILVRGRPRVRHRRFGIRVRFAAAAPAGTAVVEVLRGRRVIGIARTQVVRGKTKRLRVKLTPRGHRALARSRTRKLSIKLRVRVGRSVLRSKRVTVRR